MNRNINMLAVLSICISVSLSSIWPAIALGADVIPINEIAPPTVSYNQIPYNQGGYIFLDYDDRAPVFGWDLMITKLSDFSRQNPEFRVNSQSSPPPPSVFWNATDAAPYDGVPLPEGEYLLYFEVAYQSIARNQTSLIQIGGHPDVTPVEAPIVTPDTLLANQGGSIHIDYSPYSSTDIPVHFWTFSLNSKSGQYHYGVQGNPRGYFGLRLADVPTVLHWDSTSSPDQVIQAGEYTLSILIVGLTHRGMVDQIYTYDLKVVDSNQEDETVEDDTDADNGQVDGEQDTLSPEEKAEQERIASLHPVLLIHGLNAMPDMWRDAKNHSDYVSLLQDWGYPTGYIATYAYSGTGDGPDDYNNQGSIVEVSAGMREAVMDLRQKSLDNGGDGEVDIVAHSMGGLVTRQYIKEHPKDNFLNDVVAIGTPFEGSWLLGPYSESDDLSKELIKLLIGGLVNNGIGVDLRSQAVIDLAPNSRALYRLSRTPKTKSVQYYNLYSDIRIRHNYMLFNLNLRSSIESIGDGVVGVISARTISPAQVSINHGFRDKSIVRESHIEIMQLDYGYAKLVSYIEAIKSPLYHTALPSNSLIKGRVVKILSN